VPNYTNLFQRSYRFLSSRELTISLFLLLCLILIPRTFVETKDIRLGWPGNLILAVMALNLALCTVKRVKGLSKPVIIMHLGTILILAGGVASSFGFIATVNIYEGTSVNSAYRWDQQKDIPLGIDLALKKITIEYYPVPIKIGVLRGEEKIHLFEVKTGGQFTLEPYTVRADYIELPSENLRLSVFEGGRIIGFVDTEGAQQLPPDFPYDFKLVAYKNPFLKKVKTDLTISKNSKIIAEGTSEVNSPLTWEKLSFYNINVDSDDHGLRFAGFQITHDPGRPLVYFGFLVSGVGSVFYFARRIRGNK
jgi:hypothetical protein